MSGSLFLEKKQISQCAEAVSAVNIWKSFAGKVAVQNLNLNISCGELFGLIGPDGAGKTTLMQIISGAMLADAGEMKVLGITPHEAKTKLGYMTQHFSLYPDLSVIENLQYLAAMRAVPMQLFQRQQSKYLRKLGLAQYKDRLASQLSGGMKQKLAFCAALISNPQLLLLDEPCTGVDPLSRAEFWEILNEVRAETGACIVIATPYCAEAEQCDRVALMNDGRLELCDTPYHLKMQFQLKRIEMHCSDMEQALLSLSKGTEYGEHLYEDLQVLGDRIELLVKDPSRAIAGVNECLTESAVQVHSMQVKELTMENVFFLHLARSKEPITGNGLSPRDRGRLARPARFYDFESHATEPLRSVAISAEHLCKMFGSFSAVKDFSLQIKSGEIYGLLGANGAGKTTAIKMLCGLQQASAGAVRICGTAPADLRRANVRKMIGYVSQKNSLYGDLTVLENLEFFASVYELSPQSKREAMEFVEDLFKLGSCKHHLVDTLPSGWKQRVAFAAAIMHKPQVLFLDEPTAGVDPAARRSLWEIIRMLAQEGAAILVTTHILEEAENCNRIGLMLSGELIAEGSPSEIKAKTYAANLEEAFLRIMAKHKRC